RPSTTTTSSIGSTRPVSGSTSTGCSARTCNPASSRPWPIWSSRAGRQSGPSRGRPRTRGGKEGEGGLHDRRDESYDVVVVGGGVAGLAAALEAVSQAGTRGTPSVLLLEASDRVGGKVRTVREQGYVVEAGPDCFVTSKPG